MPTYEYVCEDGHRTIMRNRTVQDKEIECQQMEIVKGTGAEYPCLARACRVPFYLDTTVTGLPTRAPLLPPRPGPRSSKGESSDTAGEMMDEFAHKSYQWDRKYAAGGEYAEGDWASRPKSRREE